MGYDVELMSIGADIYPLLQRSAAALNGLQSEFRFHLTSSTQRQDGVSFERSSYVTSDIWAFLRVQKEKFGGNRPYIIAFVTKPLQSSQLGNIFGSHEAAEGLAVVTMFGAGQYVKEESRYCCYYLTRYSMSFINPQIKAHDDGRRKNCYFHKKMYKPDIRASMDTGYLCDECMNQLDHPPPGDVAHRLSEEERGALQKMRQFVSGDLPHAIVMKGGGVKGLAFAGALLELERYFWFDRHVGTSAGAIAAVLLAAAYTPSELRDLLLEKDFRDFMDSPTWKIPINLLFQRGCYPGESFRLWLAELLHKKISKLAEIPMANLNGALIYAARWGTGAVAFDSFGERKDTVAAFAARCSMSIPIFFVPMQIDGRRVFDGGLRNNFPLSKFLADHPRSNFVALYLGKPDNRNKRSFGSELLDIAIDGEERQTVDANIDKVVVIDTSPVGTVDFRLTPKEKEFLLAVGKASALKFLLQRNLDDGPSHEDVNKAQADAEEKRALVQQTRIRRRRRRIALSVSIFLLVSLLFAAGSLVAWRIPSRIDFERKGPDELDKTFAPLLNASLEDASRHTVKGGSGVVTEIFQVTWSKPYFAAKHFALEVRSNTYPIAGSAAIHESRDQQKAIPPCIARVKDDQTVVFPLPTEKTAAVIFLRVTVPDLDSYTYPDMKKLKLISIGAARLSDSCSADEGIQK